MMRCAIYVRVSKKNNDSALHQKQILEQYARARKWTYKVFADNGEPGDRQSRPQYTQMLKLTRQREFDVVLVWKLDRFGKCLHELVIRLAELEALGVQFVSFTETVDTTTPIGKLVFAVIGAMAEFEHSILRERTIKGLQQAKKNGKQLGRRRVEVDTDLIRKLRENGLSWRQIAKKTKVSEATLRRRCRERWPDKYPSGVKR